jgi:predicted amidohydrolase
VINREGNIIGRYDKKYLYKVNRPDFRLDENDDTIPGQTIGLFEIEGIKIGVGICFDLRFPEYFRELAKGGAEIIFLPAHFNKSTGAVAWDVLPRARAIENQVYFCAVNQTGEKLCADTKIIKYDGENLRALGNEEGMLTADLDLEAQKRYREEMPILEL